MQNHVWFGTNRLEGLRLTDKEGNTLLECGTFEPVSDKRINVTIEVREEEKIVGVRSKIWKNRCY